MQRTTRDGVPGAQTPLDLLPISNRTRKRLLERGFRTTDEVAALSDAELLALPGFGETCLAELRTALALPLRNGGDSLWPQRDRFPEDLRRTPVTRLPVPNRARRVFAREGIRTVDDVLRLGPDGLLRLRHFGRTSLEGVRRALLALLRGESDRVEDVVFPERRLEASGATSVDVLDLPRRARRALRDLGVRTLSDLARRPLESLLGRRNFGQASLRRLRREVERFLREETGDPTSFARLLDRLLLRLHPKERRLVEMREGIDAGAAAEKRRTLQEVGRALGITESRACQIEHAAWRKLVRFAAGPLDEPAERIRRLALERGGVAPARVLLEDAFFGDEGLPVALQARLLARLAPHRIALLDDDRIVAAPAATVQALVVRLRKRLHGRTRARPLAPLAREVLRGQGLGDEGFEIVRALVEVVLGREVVPADGNDWIVRTATEGFADDIERVLDAAGRPLHFGEIARRLRLAPFSRAEVDEERVRLRLCRDPRFQLVHRGTYDLRRRLLVPATDRKTWADAAWNVLAEIGRPTSVAVLRRALAERGKRPPPSDALLARVLRDDPRFAQVGRGAFAPAKRGRRVARVSELLVGALEEAGGPLSYGELRERVQRERRVSDGAISATLVGRDLFLRLDRGLFDLARRHPFDAAERRRLAGEARLALLERGGFGSLDELARRVRWPRGCTHTGGVLLGDLLRRHGGFRHLRGGSVALDDPALEESLAERALAVLRGVGRPLSAAELARLLALGPAARELLRDALSRRPEFVTEGRGRFAPAPPRQEGGGRARPPLHSPSPPGR